MNSRIRLAIAASLAGIAATAPVRAHHSFSGVFDAQQAVTLRGTVTKFDFINPHGRVYFDVRDEKTGKVTNWSAEVGNPNALLRLGWTKTAVKAGDALTVAGVKARDGSNFMLGQAFTLSDGRQLFGSAPNATQ